MSFSSVIHQNLVDVAGSDGKLDVIFMNMAALNEDYADLRTLVERNEGRPLGLSGTFLLNGTLQVLAVADATTVILIDFAGDKNNGRGSSPSNPSLPTDGRDYLRDQVLGRSCGFLYAFDMGLLALALWQNHDLRIQQAIDVQSAGTTKTRAPQATIAVATARGKENNITFTFGAQVLICKKPHQKAAKFTTHLAQRAWVAHYVSQVDSMEDRLSKVPPIDTIKLSVTILCFLAKSVGDSFQKDQQKPDEVTRAYPTSFDDQNKELLVKSDSYKNKIRKGQDQQVDIQVPAQNGTGAYSVPAGVSQAVHNVARLRPDGDLAGKAVSTITILGRDDPTLAEVKRARKLLEALQGKITDFGPWNHKIFFGENVKWPAEWSQSPALPIKLKPDTIPRPLNTSQQKAVRCMLDETDSTRLTIIQGPPGTGKTTVIASYVLRAVSGGRSGIWLIAQSNIAVKNIAEKLADFGLFKWRLLVAEDFYAHYKHLYTTIKTNTITSGGFFQGRLHELSGCPVVLCTLSMLSSDVLMQQGAFSRAPLHTVVIDEASQIEIGDYIPLFTSFTHTIRKVVFIGDNKQLPPHGQDQIEGLQSIFEVDHLVKQDTPSGKNPFIFLDTQYRMPPQIGDFIAQTVYCTNEKDSEALLKSSDHHPLANEESLLCHFVNVTGKQTRIAQGTSWKNVEECQAIVKLASTFQAEGKKYRIITPYEEQRILIEEQLKKAELEWGDKCFNVDSFQGHEEDYIIISLVRSRDLGFLSDLRRVNVMLTRCKRGMIIFTSKAYIENHAGPGKSLIGKLISDWYGNSAWIEVGDLEGTCFV